MNSINKIGLILLALGLFGWSACNDSNLASEQEAEAVASELNELEALIESASKASEDTQMVDFEDMSENPCFNLDSAIVRISERAKFQKFQSELTAVAAQEWPENAVFIRLNTLENKQQDRLTKFEEVHEVDLAILDLGVGLYEDAELEALYNELSERMSTSETEALFALAYAHEFMISNHIKAMENRRNEGELLRARLENGEATACDSLRVKRMIQERAKQNVPGLGQGPKNNQQLGNKTKKGPNGPMILRYIIKYLENEGITYEFQLLDPDVLAIGQKGPQGKGPKGK